MNKLYRDNIWGDIELDELAVKIMDTPEFQRLDGIKQLGFADYVYRGAKHTRFLHSVGVYHVTKRIIDTVVENHKRMDMPPPKLNDKFAGDNSREEEEYATFTKKMETIKRIVSVVGLMHDITHIPFGHSLEDEFSLYDKHDSIESLRLHNLLFDKRSEIYKVFMEREEPWIPPLSNEELLQLIFVILKYKCTITPEDIKSFDDEIGKAEKRIKEKGTEESKEKLEMLKNLGEWYEKFTRSGLFYPFMSDIFGNTLCADLLDYIIRDSRGAGLQMGYDEKIFRFFFIGEDTNNRELRLALSIFDKRGDERFDVLSEIIEIMQMRHALAERIYYHKTKAIATSMLISLLKEIEEDLPKDSNPYDDPNSVLNFTDSKLFEYLEEKCTAEQLELLKMLKTRKLYKIGAVIPIKVVDNLSLNVNENFVKHYYRDQRGEKKNLERKTKVNKDVIIYCPPEHPQAKEIQTFIQTRDKTRVAPLNQIKQDLTIKTQVEILSKEKYKQLWKFFLFLHPDDAENEIVVSKTIKKFCEEIVKGDQKSFENLIRDRDFVKHPKDKPLSKLRRKLMEAWKKEKDYELLQKGPVPTLDWGITGEHSFVYPKIHIDMEYIVSEEEEWMKYETSEFTQVEEYFCAFELIWWELFKEKHKGEKDIDSKKLGDIGGSCEKIRIFQQDLVGKAIEIASESRRQGGRSEYPSLGKALRDAEEFLLKRL